MRVGVEDCLGLVGCSVLGELSVLFELLEFLFVGGRRNGDIVRAKVERAKGVERHFRVKPEGLRRTRVDGGMCHRFIKDFREIVARGGELCCRGMLRESRCGIGGRVAKSTTSDTSGCDCDRRLPIPGSRKVTVKSDT